MPNVTRRELLTGSALVLLHETAARAGVIAGTLPWKPAALAPTPAVPAAGWVFFTDAEAALVGAIADRIIPPDADTPGGKDAGCAVFLDRQLAGAYGRREGLYVRPPFDQGAKQQGPQSAASPAEMYRAALADLEAHTRASAGNRSWTTLTADEQDASLRALESGALRLPHVDAQAFFAALLKDLQEGFFADPMYGGNRDMCAWKMIGFPGARYDYRDWVARHNERYPHPPVSIMGRQDWNVSRS